MNNNTEEKDYIYASTIIALIVGMVVGYRLELILNWMVGG